MSFLCRFLRKMRVVNIRPDFSNHARGYGFPATTCFPIGPRRRNLLDGGA